MKTPLPEALANAPVMPEWLEFYFNAFTDLCTCRSGGDGPIAWTALDTYAIRHGLTDPDEYMFFKELINALDLAYTDHQRKKSETNKTAIGKQPSPAVRPQVKTREQRRGRP